MLEFSENYSQTHSTDLVIIGGDLNSTPSSAVYSVFQSLTDTLLDHLGQASLAAPEHATWGQTSNTFTGSGGRQEDGHVERIDYILYRVRTTNPVKSAETVHYQTVKQFAHKSDGTKVSLSDHDWVEATIKLNF